jgi:hypothetical protein
MPEQIPLIDPSGAVVGVEPENLERFLGQGYRPLTIEEQTAVGDEQAEAQLYNSPEHTIQAFGQGVNRGLSFGLSDLLVDGEEASKLRKHHGFASGLGEVTGAVSGGLAGASGRAGAGLLGRTVLRAPSALSARAAQSVARRVAGGELGRTAGQKIVGGAVEAAVDGGFYGAGQAISEAALGNDPLTVDRLTASIGMNALFGGGIGGGLGAVGAASGAIRKKLAAKANPLLNPRSSGSKELGEHIGRVAREADKGVDDALRLAQERLRNERAAQLIETHATTGPVGINAGAAPRPAGRGLARFAAEAQSGPIIPPGASQEVIGGFPEVVSGDPVEFWRGVAAKEAVEETSAEVVGTAVVGRNKFKNAKRTQAGVQPGWRTPEAPEQVFDEAVVQPGFSAADALAAADASTRQDLGALRKQIASARRGLVERFGSDFKVDMAALTRKSPAQAFKSIDAWDTYAKALRDVDKAAGTQLSSHLDDILGGLIKRSEPELAGALEKIGKLDRRGVADALKLDVSKLPAASSPAADLLLRAYSVGRFAEDFGAKAAVKVASSKVGGSGLLGGAMGATGALFGGVPGAAAAAALFVMGNPNRSLMRLATMAGKIAVRFAEGIDNFVQRATSRKSQRIANLTVQGILSSVRFSEEKEDTSVAVPVRRMRELQQLLANPGRLDAYVDDQLTALRAHNLDLGFSVADSIKARIRFYGSKMPSLPPPDVFTGWQEEPSEAELHDWSKYVAAGEHPEIILQELRDGDLTPETVETLQVVYPALFGEMQSKLAQAIPQLRNKLEYADKLNLSLLYDVPVEQTATDDMFFALQEMHALRQEEEQKQAAKPMAGTPKPHAPTKAQLLTDR